MKFGKALSGSLVVVAFLALIIGAVFIRDVERSVAAYRGAPASGAEDASLYTLREQNRRGFGAIMALAIADPMAAQLYTRHYHAGALDTFIFAADEAAAKSPFSWPKALVAPGVLSCQYASNWFDTDPVLVGTLCSVFILDDILMWFSLFSLLSVAGVAAVQYHHLAHHSERISSYLGDIASVEIKSIATFVFMRVLHMGVGVALTYGYFALSFLVPNVVLDFFFGYFILVNLAFAVDCVAHLFGLTFMSDVLDVITNYRLRVAMNLAVAKANVTAPVAVAMGQKPEPLKLA